MGRWLNIDRIEGHSFVSNWLQPGAVVLDCGMNVGSFARSVTDRFGCRVIGIEPNAVLAEENRSSRGLECHRFAITRDVGPVSFHVDQSDLTASAMVRNSSGMQELATETVPGIPLHQFLLDFDVGHVDLLKLDIEGAELDVFATCPMAVLQSIPQITVEFHAFLDPAQRGPVLDIIARMRAAGFHATDFSRNLMNVLFLNEALRSVPTLDKARMAAIKYVSGAARLLGRPGS